MGDTAEKFKNETFQLISDIQQDLRNEWQSDEPSVNFFLLLGILLALIIYLVFITFYFSRIIGTILGYVITRFLRWRSGSSFVKVQIGSFSISILSGKIMVRNFTYTNNNLSFHINDGWLIFSYWRPVPKKCPPSKAMNSSRLHISLNGVKVHIYNRLDLYQLILKTAGQTVAAAKLSAEIGEDAAAAAAAQQRALRHQPPPDKLDEWWDNFWRLSGMIKLDISSGRIICGNHLMPCSFATVFEDLKSKIFLSDASNEQDRFMLK
uniref:Bridge-like lipid transfer protein family member 1 N-terminal domain-containing protein n=1 Tax=Panagrolaimus sp. PS1159 TaxID=55785 RepID=A0AC35FE25_9BILA